MNYYFIPGTGIYGGIKVACRFAELLTRLDAPCCIATPDGAAPSWLQSSVSVLSQDNALSAARSSDNILFSLPHDYPRLRTAPSRLVFHCQGTDPLIDPILTDPGVALLSCWPQATSYIKEKSGRQPIEVGLPISSCFFYRGAPKRAGTVAFMPRRGAEIAEACRALLPGLQFIPIDGATEDHTARLLQSAEFFLATAVNEWFGLPAFEAMAAGCVVLSVPVLGGMDYLVDGDNALVTEPQHMPERLAWISDPGRRLLRAQLRDRGIVTAQAFRLLECERRLALLLAGELSYLRA